MTARNYALQIRINETELQALRRLAAREERSMSDTVRRLLRKLDGALEPEQASSGSPPITGRQEP